MDNCLPYLAVCIPHANAGARNTAGRHDRSCGRFARPFEQLLVLTNAITLAVFALVDLALWRVQRNATATAQGVTVPRWISPLGVVLSLMLMLAEFLI